MTWGNRNFLMAGGNKKWIEFSYRDWWPQATDKLLWRTFLVSSRTCLFNGMSDTIDKLLALKLGIYSTHLTTKNLSSWLECANHIKPSPLLPNLWSQELFVCLLLYTVHSRAARFFDQFTRRHLFLESLEHAWAAVKRILTRVVVFCCGESVL